METFSVNIIIPTYSPGNYFFECLKSIKKQTISDFFCTIVLNGPREPHQQQIQNWLTELEITNAVLLYSPEKGVSVARNLALECNSCEYVLFVDDDDLINPEYLSELLKYGARDTIVQAEVLNFNNGDTGNLRLDYMGREFRNNNMKECIPGQCPSVFSSCCGKLFPKRLIENVRFNKTLNIGEDSFFMYQLLAQSVKNVVYTSGANYLRRERKESVSRKKHSVFSILRNRFKLAFLFSSVYFSHMNTMEFSFFFRRLAAIFTKGFIKLLIAGR